MYFSYVGCDCGNEMHLHYSNIINDTGTLHYYCGCCGSRVDVEIYNGKLDSVECIRSDGTSVNAFILLD